MDDRDFIGKMLFMTAGLLVWAVHFLVIYAFTAVACAKRFANAEIFGLGIIPFVIGAATLVALAATGLVLIGAVAGRVPMRSVPSYAAGDPFLRYGATVIATLALVAIVWNAVPVLTVNFC